MSAAARKKIKAAKAPRRKPAKAKQGPRRRVAATPGPPLGRQGVLDLMLLLGLGGVLLLAWPGRVGLLEPGEASLALAAKTMLAQGPWLVPPAMGGAATVPGPWPVWLAALGLGLGGASELWVRLGAGLSGLAVLVVTYLWGRALWERRTGLWAGLVLASSLLFLAVGRSADGGMGLCLGLTLALYGAWGAREGRGWGGQAFWLGCLLGLLNRGLWGAALPVELLLLFSIVSGEWAIWRKLAPWRGWAPAAGLGLLWLGAAWLFHPDYLAAYLIDIRLGRVFASPGEGPAPLWFWLVVLPGAFLPWVCLLPWALARLWPGADWRQAPARPWLWLAIWCGLLLVVVLLGGSRGTAYLVCLLPPLAIALARPLAALLEADPSGLAPPGLAAGLGALALVILGLGVGLHFLALSGGQHLLALIGPAAAGVIALVLWLGRSRVRLAGLGPLAVAILVLAGAAAAGPSLDLQLSPRPWAEMVREQGRGAELAAYGPRFAGLEWYAGRTVRRFGPGDLAALRRRLVDPRPDAALAVLAREDDYQALARRLEGTPGLLLFVWQRTGGLTLFSNRPR